MNFVSVAARRVSVVVLACVAGLHCSVDGKDGFGFADAGATSAAGAAGGAAGGGPGGGRAGSASGGRALGTGGATASEGGGGSSGLGSGGASEAGAVGDSGSDAGGAGPTEGECTPGVTRACSEGGLLGPCADGVETCGDDGLWGLCSIPRASSDSCERGNDDDCDGAPNGNAACSCIEGETRACSAGGALGNCALGEQICGKNGQFGACSVEPLAKDRCDVEGDDSDCDGTPNTGCPCVDGKTQPCGTAAVGVCKLGLSTCVDALWGACEGAVGPRARDCSSALDNDCDGSPDNTLDATCECPVGAQRACNTHPGKDGKGPCKAGQQVCALSASKASSWGACNGAVGPATADSCATVGDDANCSGTPNDGCDCVSGEKATCGTVRASKGVCAAAQLTCTAQGTWPTSASLCAPAGAEACAADGKDEDCDGAVNENCDCSAGQTRTCAQGGFSGPCAGGTQTCSAAGTWGACSILPGIDTCVSGNDASCNGVPNEGCLCVNGVARSCGPCGDGTQTCTNGKTGAYSACSKPTAPVYYRDSDSDTFGDPDTTTTSCMGAPVGYVANSRDCCDADAKAKPDQTEPQTGQNACGDFDYDCDGNITRDYGHLNGCTCDPFCGTGGSECAGCGCPGRCTQPCGQATGGGWYDSIGGVCSWGGHDTVVRCR